MGLYLHERQGMSKINIEYCVVDRKMERKPHVTMTLNMERVRKKAD